MSLSELGIMDEDLNNPEIPLFPPLVLSPSVIDRARNKSIRLVELALNGTDIRKKYPEAYNEILEDLGAFAQDFDAYKSHANKVIGDLSKLRQSSGKRWLERYEYAPFYGLAKFRSALVVFAQDKGKLHEVKNLITQYRMASGQFERERERAQEAADLNDDWHADLCDE